MSPIPRQQIIVSGVGGQGVLFATRILAEAALAANYHVLLSETHGMAQKGGNVISHVKITGVEVPPFTSPLIRPGHADLFLGLHPQAFADHGFYLKPDGRAVRNEARSEDPDCLDAAEIAASLGSSISVNLVMLGFAASSRLLFCDAIQLEETVRSLSGPRADTALRLFRAGLDRGRALSL